MRQYGAVHTRFWIGESASNMTDKQKLLYLYLLTSPHSNPIGCYRLPLSYIQSDLKWSSETVTETVTETVSIGLIEYDFKLEIVLIKRFIEFNPIANPNVAKSCIQFIDIVSKKSTVYQHLIESLKPFTQRFPNGYINGLPNGMPNRDPNPDPNPDIKKESKKTIAKKDSDYSLEFETFWTAYPTNNGSKKKSSEIFQRIIKNGENHERIISGAGAYAAFVAHERTDQRFIKHAETWLNGGNWETGYTLGKPAPGSGTGKGEQARSYGNELLEEMGNSNRI